MPRSKRHFANPLGGKCTGCGEWTERETIKMCLDCERVAKEKRETKTCLLPGCEEVFRKAGQAKYCVKHRGMARHEMEKEVRALARLAS